MPFRLVFLLSLLGCGESKPVGQEAEDLQAPASYFQSFEYSLNDRETFMSAAGKLVSVCPMAEDCDKAATMKVADAICSQAKGAKAESYTTATLAPIVIQSDPRSEPFFMWQSLWVCDLQTSHEVELCAWSRNADTQGGNRDYFQQIKCAKTEQVVATD